MSKKDVIRCYWWTLSNVDGDTSVTSIIKFPSQVNDSSKCLLAPVGKSVHFWTVNRVAWFQFPIKLEREELVHGLYILDPLCLNILWEYLVPRKSCTPKLLQINSEFYCNWGNKTEWIPKLSKESQAVSLRNSVQLILSACLSHL